MIPALPGHAVAVASRLRRADARELWAAGGHTPEQAVRESLRRSLEPGGRAWAVILDNGGTARAAERHGALPAMLFGVVPFSPLSDTGAPWMLATDLWDDALAGGLNLTFARRCRRYLADMGRGFTRLENHVHAANHRAIRWLGWLGFRFDPPAPFGVRGEMFLRFWMEVR